MSTLDYSSRTRLVTARFPLLSYLAIQINFWIIANIVLALIIFFFLEALNTTFNLNLTNRLWPHMAISVMLGILYGSLVGTADYFLDKDIFRRKSLGMLMLIKSLVGIAVLILVFMLIRYILFKFVIANIIYNRPMHINKATWKYLFAVIFIYYILVSIVTNFINQVRKKYGPGVLLPLLLGKYRHPVEEERIFLFMDLRSSTTIAEELGHVKYSSMIRDCIFDINKLLPKYGAEVYQYVGDEIVMTWQKEIGLQHFMAIRFFLACAKMFEERKTHYEEAYGQVPFFKAGMHMGKVTAVEIGEVKRDIAYHGDTINIAARIQSQCNVFGKTLLISDAFLEQKDIKDQFIIQSIGTVLLKGKTKKVAIFSVEGMVGGQDNFKYSLCY